ncbi:MAG: hypothetical protein RMJ56_00625 [Gemmataceae bacterium]|nr:hypothetical protein [Gemmata sp.]MDW8196084.1 hypothetical protein [Gemmataceae bacterium]
MTTAPEDSLEFEEKSSQHRLSQRQVVEHLLQDERIRPYTFAAIGSLAMTALVLYLSGSEIGAALVMLLGSASILLRWTAGPIVVLLLLLYFTVFPFGYLELGYNNPLQVRETHFRISDMILVMAALVYFATVYRLFGLIHQSVPLENTPRRQAVPPRRPSSHIGANEVTQLVVASAVLVVLGQVAWWLLNAFDFTPTEAGFPLQWADRESFARYRSGPFPPGEFSAGQSRFFLTMGVLFFGYLFFRLFFGYWRLRVMSPAEGALMLANSSWAESHRERVRIEKWRVWGRERAKARRRKEQQRLLQAQDGSPVRARPTTQVSSRLPKPTSDKTSVNPPRTKP